MFLVIMVLAFIGFGIKFVEGRRQQNMESGSSAKA